MTFGLACCAVEMMQTSMRYDLRDLVAPRPHKTVRCNDSCRDINKQNGSSIKKVYDQMPEPRYVVSMGAAQMVEATIIILIQW